MAQKKTYLYRMLIGNDETDEIDIFMFARNSKTATEYCKKLYKDMKYTKFKPIKVGVSLYPRETGLVSKEDDAKLRNSIAVKGERYCEREVVMPKFITKEEAGDFDL